MVNWDKVATVIFWLASVLFAALSWWYSVLAYSRDNAKISFKAKKMTLMGELGRPNQDVIWLTICNIGRRVVYFQKNLFCSHYEKNKHVYIPPNSPVFINNTWEFPEKLMEGEQYSIVLDYKEFVDEFKEKRITSFLVHDTLWNTYVASLSYKEFPEITEPWCFSRLAKIFKSGK